MAAILKIIKCDISATVWPVLVKFGTAMHIGLPIWRSTKNFKNPRWQMASILIIEKLRYLQNHLADFDEILHDDTY